MGSALDSWLVQDAIFVADLLTFQATLLARAKAGPTHSRRRLCRARR